MKTLLLVDDDPNLLRGLKRGLPNSLRNQWQMIYADSGMQAGADPLSARDIPRYKKITTG